VPRLEPLMSGDSFRLRPSATFSFRRLTNRSASACSHPPARKEARQHLAYQVQSPGRPQRGSPLSDSRG